MTLVSCLSWLFFTCLPLSATVGTPDPSTAASTTLPLSNAYAHNDYWHKRPLFDALDNGYTHIEVDIFRIGNEFIVSHFFPVFGSGRTLERLYLQPLYQHIIHNNGNVYKDYDRPVVLMIDIKMNGNSTYRALRLLLEKYRSILTSYDNGIITERQVTVVLSGSKPYDEIRKENRRLAFIDEDLRNIIHSKDNNSISPVASCRFGSLLKWNGDGPIPAADRTKLCSFVRVAHSQGKKVRLWATPEREEVWRILLDCGIDLINTDKLADLRKFLLANIPPDKNSITASR